MKTIQVAILAGLALGIAVTDSKSEQKISIEDLKSLDLQSPREYQKCRIAIYQWASAGEHCSEILRFVSELDKTKQKGLISSAIDKIVSEDPEALLNWIEEDKDRISLHLDEDDVGELASSKPMRSLELVRKLCPIVPLPEVDGSNPDAARLRYTNAYLCWFENAVVSNAFGSLASSDTDEALVQLQDWSAHELYYKKGMAQISGAWAKRDLEGVLEFVNAKKHSTELQDEMLVAIVDSVGRQMLGEKGNILDIKLPQLSERIAVELVRENTASAAEVVTAAMEIEDTRLRARLLESVVREWLRHTPEKALDWVGNCEKGKDKDFLIDICISSSNTALATKLVKLIDEVENKDLIESLAYVFFRKWYLLEPTSAMEALEDSRVSEKGKRRTREVFQKLDASERAAELRKALLRSQR